MILGRMEANSADDFNNDDKVDVGDVNKIIDKVLG